jgi:CDP-4-dehydro-6-deoxyglucose reductase, E3
MSNHSREYILEKFIHLTPDIYQVFLRPKTPLDELHHLAGQFVSMLYPDGSYQPLSIANAPKDNAEIELHIRCLANDKNTQAFLAQLKQHKLAHIKGPFGECIYRDNDKPTLLLAAGTGFAQAKALIEQACVKQSYPLMHLYWGVKTPRDFYLPELTQYWRSIISHFYFTPVISKLDVDSPWVGRVGYVPELAVADHTDLKDFQVYVSGPKMLTVAAFELLQKYKLPMNFFYSDML